MDYDILLKHKSGKAMVPADALSWRHDHSEGIEEPKETTALSDELFLNLADTELRDAVVDAQESDELAQQVQDKLTNVTYPDDNEKGLQANPQTKWTISTTDRNKTGLFYDGRFYVPDNLELCRQIVQDHHDTEATGHPGILAN
jgi:hypothetical protein